MIKKNQKKKTQKKKISNPILGFPASKKFWKSTGGNFLIWAIIFISAITIVQFISGSSEPKKITYSQLINYISDKKIISAEVVGNNFVGVLKDPEISYIGNTEKQIDKMKNHYLLKLPSILDENYFCIFINNNACIFLQNYLSKMNSIRDRYANKSHSINFEVNKYNIFLEEFLIPQNYVSNLSQESKEAEKEDNINSLLNNNENIHVDDEESHSNSSNSLDNEENIDENNSSNIDETENENKASVRRLSLFDNINEPSKKFLNNSLSEDFNSKNEPILDNHDNATDELREEIDSNEFEPEDEISDEEINQEQEEELLDIPTFLRRQAN